MVFYAAGDHSGGYEHDFVVSVSHKYMCVICEKVPRDARLTACCGQHFCDSCLARWTGTSGSFGGRSTRKKTCPHCRSKNFQSILNKEKIREIIELRVRCTHSKKGCQWQGELGALKQHLESCDYVIVCCQLCGFAVVHTEPLFPNDPFTRACFGLPIPENPFWGSMFDELQETCRAKMERRHLSEHQETECVYRMYNCEHCGYEDTYDAIAGSGRVRKEDSEMRSEGNHYEGCPQFPLECPNKCGTKAIKRRNMKAHRNKCTKEQVECPFGSNACIVARANVEKECEFRPYTCEYCGTEGTFSSITGQENFKFYHLLEGCHYDECEKFPVDCPRGCGEKGKDLKIHRCPLQPADCPFTHVGCDVKMPQREMDTHCHGNMQDHLLMMARSLQELSDKNKDLVQKNEELTRKNEELTSKNEALSRKVEDMDKEMLRRYETLGGEIDYLDERFSRRYEDLEQRIDGLQLAHGSNRGQYRNSRYNNRRRGQNPMY
jgi:hypothetical protein